MDKKLFIEKTLTEMGIPLVTPTRYKKDIVLLILNGSRGANVTFAAASKITKKYFPNKPKNVSIFNWLCSIHDKKRCFSCDQVLDYDLFNKNAATNDGLQSICRECDRLPSRIRASMRHSRLKQRTPPWSEEIDIALLYANCPIGYHVDPIVPLNGENVSGLHVLANLQYLTAEENLKKSNKF
jgi:hypothetical protein